MAPFRRRTKDKEPEVNTTIHYPLFSTCVMCTNRLSDICHDECAPKKNYQHFKMRSGTDLLMAPRFPLSEFVKEMPGPTRLVVVAIYLALIVDYLQAR